MPPRAFHRTTKSGQEKGFERMIMTKLSIVVCLLASALGVYTSFAYGFAAKNEASEQLPKVTARFKTPSLYFGRHRVFYKIMSDVCVNLQGGKGSIKNPIVRVAILLKGADGVVYMQHGILTRPGSMNVKDCPPIYSYGGRSVGGYSLEELSYQQPSYSDQFPRSAIKYFNKTDSQEELFAYPERIIGKSGRPNILCFRFECWQNGKLVGIYDSKSPAQLKARNIPQDWFIWGKYSDRFKYRDNSYDVQDVINSGGIILRY